MRFCCRCSRQVLAPFVRCLSAAARQQSEQQRTCRRHRRDADDPQENFGCKTSVQTQHMAAPVVCSRNSNKWMAGDSIARRPMMNDSSASGLTADPIKMRHENALLGAFCPSIA